MGAAVGEGSTGKQTNCTMIAVTLSELPSLRASSQISSATSLALLPLLRAVLVVGEREGGGERE